MSWMSEISILVEEAGILGVRLHIGDFKRVGNSLHIRGVDADQWMKDRRGEAPADPDPDLWYKASLEEPEESDPDEWYDRMRDERTEEHYRR